MWIKGSTATVGTRSASSQPQQQYQPQQYYPPQQWNQLQYLEIAKIKAKEKDKKQIKHLEN
ncbi:MAG: hypothetical protein NQ127_03335 [Candidatus Cardinium sp.]|nr:hypothetical protein [Candidatus Cardinium sp.]